ncbi:hypothetical protein ACQ4LE_003490 [Meloidogyne hapla]
MHRDLRTFLHYIFVAILLNIVGRDKEAYSMAINQNQSTPANLQLMGFMGMNQTLSDGVIQLLANKSAESITPTVYSAIKEAFASFAPDSWVNALDKIKISTFRCVVRESTLIGLKIYSKLNSSGSTLTNSTNEQVKAILASMNYTQDQVLSMLASKCSDGWNEILNLCHAVNATMSKLPPHVIQIFSKYNDSSMTSEDNGMKIIQDFQTLTPDELVQMGELFPKLKWLFSLNFYKLMDLLAQTMQGDEEAKMKFEELGMKMYQNRNKCY